MRDLQGRMFIQGGLPDPDIQNPSRVAFSLSKESLKGTQAVDIHISDWEILPGDPSFFFTGGTWDLAAGKWVGAKGRYDPNAEGYKGFVDFNDLNPGP